jgi:hypothetical protein
MLYRALLLGATLLVSGCLSPGETRLPGGSYHLQPAGASPSLNKWVEVTVEHQKGREKFLVHALNTEHKTRIALIDPASLATLLSCAAEDGVFTRSGIIPERIVPTELPLCLLQIAEWPKTSVEAGLRGGLVITEKDGVRSILSGDQQVAVISYEDGEVRAVHVPVADVTIRLNRFEAR